MIAPNRYGRRKPTWSSLRRSVAISLAAGFSFLAFTPGGIAQNTAMSTKVITLGTQGGPLTVGKRAQPANAVVVGDRVYLVDAGNGVARQIAAAGLDHRRVGHVFITHNHNDHNADWGTLVGLQWNTGKSSPTHVFGPLGTHSMRDGFIQYFEPNARVRLGDLKIPMSMKEMIQTHEIIKDGLVFEDDRVKVTATEVCHYHFDPASAVASGGDKAFAFRFQTPDKVIVFSGDTGNCLKLVEFARDADILVHAVISLPLIAESMRRFLASQPLRSTSAPPGLTLEDLMRHMRTDHTSPEDIGKLAKAARVKSVVLSHFVPGADSDPDSVYVDGVKAHYDGPVTAAHDLQAF